MREVQPRTHDSSHCVRLCYKSQGDERSHMLAQERLQKLVGVYHMRVMKVMLAVDGMGGSDEVRASRKALVDEINGVLDVLDSIKEPQGGDREAGSA